MLLFNMLVASIVAFPYLTSLTDLFRGSIPGLPDQITSTYVISLTDLFRGSIPGLPDRLTLTYVISLLRLPGQGHVVAYFVPLN